MNMRIMGFLLTAASTLCATAALAGGPEEAVKGGDRSSVDLTVYNQNLSLIREERTFILPKGLSTVVVPDIPSTIDGTSVHFMSLTDPPSVRVLEQNYQYDLVSQAKLLERYLGRQVEFMRLDPATNKERAVSGTLLASGYAGTGGLVAEIEGKVELNPSGRLVLPSLPEGLILKPQLTWMVSSTREGTHKAELSYLAGGLSWSCTYVALMDDKGSSLDMTGWVTLTNNSGTSFHDAGLKLVAGDVNIVQDQAMPLYKAMRSDMAAEAGAAQFSQSNLFEYKLYSLQRRTNIGNNETKQVELASAHNVKTKKTYVYDGLVDQWRTWWNNSSYRSQESFGQQSNTKVGVYVAFKNEEKSGLGIALPKGKVRVYERDEEGKEQFVGEDQIDHTPKDENVRLFLGNAFDLVGERVQKDFKSYGNGRIVEETIEITMRNHKDETVAAEVYEHPWRWSQWEIVTASDAWTKVDQSTLKFPVTLPKDGEKKVRYTIRYSW
jgi:hypothetical protein